MPEVERWMATTKTHSTAPPKSQLLEQTASKISAAHEYLNETGALSLS